MLITTAENEQSDLIRVSDCRIEYKNFYGCLKNEKLKLQKREQQLRDKVFGVKDKEKEVKESVKKEAVPVQMEADI